MLVAEDRSIKGRSSRGTCRVMKLCFNSGHPYQKLCRPTVPWFGCAASCVGQAGRDGRDGRDGFGCAAPCMCVGQADWDGRDGRDVWLCCALCVGQADRDGRDGFAVLHHVWYLDGHGSCN